MSVLVLNLSVTLYMVGVIWMVQLVHYPLMASVGDESFTEYQDRHLKMMNFVVGPAMVIEAFTMVAVMWLYADRLFWLSAAGMALVLTIWISTAFLQVPCHMILQKGFNSKAHRFLVRSNWVRTLAWTLRGSIMSWMLLLTLPETSFEFDLDFLR